MVSFTYLTYRVCDFSTIAIIVVCCLKLCFPLLQL